MSARDGRIAGKIALVTGGGSGLGRAISELLAREGARVAVTDIDEAAARETVAAIESESPGAAIAIRHDVTEAAAWRAALEATVAEFGDLHVLVNNAGIAEGGSIEDTDFDTWRRVHAIDLDSVFLGCKLAPAAAPSSTSPRSPGSSPGTTWRPTTRPRRRCAT
jgi:NAD(P)-dependent dehydrogenase (short-subunit alcohol dehydrogenase family)